MSNNNNNNPNNNNNSSNNNISSDSTTTTTTNTRSNHHQPSSFPFLLIVALLFYFFSRSPSDHESHPKNQLTRVLKQRQNELIGLNQFLNLTSGNKLSDQLKSNSSSNLSSAHITPHLAYLPLNTFGNYSINQAHQFIIQWYNQITPVQNPPYLYWNNITGYIKGKWKVNEETLQWYPPPSTFLESQSNNETGSHQISPSFQSQRGKFDWIPKNFNNRSTMSNQSLSSYPSAQKIAFNLRESHQELVRANTSIIRGSIFISSSNTRDVTLEVEGVHFHDQGKFYLRGIPNEGFLDTRIHLSSALDIPPVNFNSSSSYDNSSTILNVTKATPEQIRIGHAIASDFENRIQRIEQILKKSDFSRDNDDRDSTEEDSKSNCTFLIYGGLKPITSATDHNLASRLLEEYEQSLIQPTGATLPTPQEPIFKSLLISPNCGLVLETDEMQILLSPNIRRKGTRYSWVAGAIGGFQCWLLVWQMDSRQSPSSLSRMSYFSLVSQIIMDAWMFSSHLTLAVITNNNLSTQVLLIPAFFACLNGILFGMRYSTLIRLHTPSSSTTSSDFPIANNNNNNNVSTLSASDDRIGGDSDYVQVPNPLTEPDSPTSTPFSSTATTNSAMTPHTTAAQSRFRVWIYRVKNYFTSRPLLSITFLGLSFFIIPFFIYSWQPLMLTILYSYWIPQIIHNVQQGTSRRGLRKRYVLGTTLSRLFLPLYVWGCPKNVLFVDMKPWIWLISLYSMIQAIVIILQDYLGSRFFLHGGIFKYEAGWDYHPIKLPNLQDLEDGSQEMKSDSKIIRECVICFEPINDLTYSPGRNSSSSISSASNLAQHPDQIPSRSNSISLGSTLGFRSHHSSDRHPSLFSRWSVMVPPCLHIAHTKCLENWLAIKSECPVCRRPLPPI